MKKIVLAALLSCFALPVLAEMNIAVVDMQKAISSTSAGKKAKDTLMKEFKKKENEFKKKEQDLMKRQKELEKKAMAYSEEQKRKKFMAFQQEMLAFRQEVGKSQQDLQIKERNMTEPIINKLRDIVAEIAKEKKVSIVLDKGPQAQNVIWAAENIDITDAAVKSFEKKWKK